MTEGFTKPFDRSYWVIPHKLLAGCYLGSQYPEEASRRLLGLLNCGIRYVVNLMEEHETNYYGDGIVPYEKSLILMGRELNVEIQCVRFPITDMDIPSGKQMANILTQLTKHLNETLQSMFTAGEEWGGQELLLDVTSYVMA